MAVALEPEMEVNPSAPDQETGTCQPEEQQRALVLSAVYGRTAVEISESESIPLGTAKTRIRSGLSKLRAAMTERAISDRGQK